MICAVITGPSKQHIEEQVALAQKHAALQEWRIDHFDAIDIGYLSSLRRKVTHPVIFTLRPKSQGGAFQGSEEERIAWLRKLFALEPDWVDLEFCTLAQTLAREHRNIRWILSYHNFKETPKNLETTLQSMQKIPAHLYKIATLCHTIADALFLLDLTKSTQMPLIPIPMGERFLPFRLMSALFSKQFSYAAAGEPLAPGQPTLLELVEQYRLHQERRATDLYALIGNPVSQSIGHRVHNSIFEERDHSALYVKIQAETTELPALLNWMKKGNIKGMSVTIPHKCAVMSFCNEITPDAQKIGAVNTLTYYEKNLFGANTDAPGALQALEETTTVSGKRVAILGAGGAARAIAYACKQAGGLVTIYNRTPQKAEELAKELDVSYAALPETPLDADIVINCTSSEMPIPGSAIPEKSVVMDIRPNHTVPHFLKEAEQKGCRTIPGTRMFAYQAALQYAKWFDHSIRQEDYLKAIDNAIHH